MNSPTFKNHLCRTLLASALLVAVPAYAQESGSTPHPNGKRADKRDSDNDGVQNRADNCPTTANPDQGDVDGDKIGDECDPADNRDSDKKIKSTRAKTKP